MKAKELRLMSDAEMDGKLAELRKELMKANSQIAIGTVPKSPGKVRESKKTIAKIMTIRREKALSREGAKRNE
ncbi:50S ribosomal protein L29 [Candidatus Woesearchaeota archaeon]|nr:50S ribosomal protein L29 [Candidatus Woesearchaeota archaeon]